MVSLNVYANSNSQHISPQFRASQNMIKLVETEAKNGISTGRNGVLD